MAAPIDVPILSCAGKLIWEAIKKKSGPLTYLEAWLVIADCVSPSLRPLVILWFVLHPELINYQGVVMDREWLLHHPDSCCINPDDPH